jgi:hypothetical protein
VASYDRGTPGILRRNRHLIQVGHAEEAPFRIEQFIPEHPVIVLDIYEFSVHKKRGATKEGEMEVPGRLPL